MFTDARNVFNIATIAADVHTACIRPLTRMRMGTRGMGAAGFWAMLAIPIYAATVQSELMLTYWYVWMAMVIFQRLKADKIQHHAFQGFVWMFDWCIPNEIAARWCEAASMFAIGSLLMGWSEPLGQFVFYSGFSFAFRCLIDGMTRQRQIEIAHNAGVEMWQMQERLQQTRRTSR
jgi:hypothetical protein